MKRMKETAREKEKENGSTGNADESRFQAVEKIAR